jgi:hypothetical protein
VATIDGARLGYVPWEWSEVLAVEPDAGQTFQATVVATDAESNTMSIRIVQT